MWTPRPTPARWPGGSRGRGSRRRWPGCDPRHCRAPASTSPWPGTRPPLLRSDGGAAAARRRPLARAGRPPRTPGCSTAAPARSSTWAAGRAGCSPRWPTAACRPRGRRVAAAAEAQCRRRGVPMLRARPVRPAARRGAVGPRPAGRRQHRHRRRPGAAAAPGRPAAAPRRDRAGGDATRTADALLAGLGPGEQRGGRRRADPVGRGRHRRRCTAGRARLGLRHGRRYGGARCFVELRRRTSGSGGAEGACPGAGPARRRRAAPASGRLISNRQPGPWLTTSIRPCWASISARAMARPSPAPTCSPGVRALLPR